MGYQCYQVGQRYAGYGVPAYCEYPSCRKVIDRGVSYACGGEPFSEYGCDRYFCGKHLHYGYFKTDGSKCNHEHDCRCDCAQVCERCRDDKALFPYKSEHPTWMRWMLKDKSWEEWRNDHPETVEEFKKQLSKKKK